MNDIEDLPLTEASRELRKSVALAAAVSVVKLLAAGAFVEETFRDGSDRAEYFLPKNNDFDPTVENADENLYEHIPRLQTLKKGLLLICADWQKTGVEARKEKTEDILKGNCFKNVRL